nr:zinc-dependent metalloprotease family protein [Acanthopleuribacter pedis]
MSTLAVLFFFCVAAFAQHETVWYDIQHKQLDGDREVYAVMPDRFRTVGWDLVELSDRLAEAPLEYSNETPLSLVLPLPNGEAHRFLIENSPVMAPELAMRYPEISSYRGYSADDPGITMRCDLSPKGFSATILSPEGAVFIKPMLRYDDRVSMVYARRDLFIDKSGFRCEQRGMARWRAQRDIFRGRSMPIQNELLTYRLAIAATGEYTQFHGGTVQGALAALNTTINNVNVVYERDLAVRFTIIANNDSIIYTNAQTDPYSGDPIDDNIANLDSVIGSANYDIGHVVLDGGGGAALLGVVCQAGLKAGGFTGTDPPSGPVFDIDFVAHEIGHQFGAEHTFNAETGACDGNRSTTTAYEPGSATTIMGYAGICGQNDIQPNSDPFFHIGSIEQMFNYTRNAEGAGCAALSSLSNAAPSADAGSDYTIPANTPFTLTGSSQGGNTASGLTYSWEQFDSGTASNFNVDRGDNAIFRSYAATTSPSRTFPRLDAVLDQSTVVGEVLPSTSRTLTFRFTVRNNNQGGGAVSTDQAVLTVAGGAGPFAMTAPAGGETWQGNSSQTVTWNVAGTDQAPVNCSQVTILVSTDGGQTFAQTVASQEANDGSATITVPNTASTTVRVKVACADNVFFDISNANLTIQAVTQQCQVDYSTWGQTGNGGIPDVNGNNKVDVLDFISCMFSGMPVN